MNSINNNFPEVLISERSLYCLDEKIKALPLGISNLAETVRLVAHIVIAVFALLGMALGLVAALVSCSKKPIHFFVFIAHRNADELMRAGTGVIGLNKFFDALTENQESHDLFPSTVRAYGKYVYSSSDGSEIVYGMNIYDVQQMYWDQNGNLEIRSS